LRLKGKVSIITGAASGIGRATALLFAMEGAKVVVADRDSIAGEEIVKMIKEKGGKGIFVQVNVTKASDVKRMIETALEKYGTLDVLHNNAGTNLRVTTTEMKEKDWDMVINVNLKGVFLGCKYAIPIMMKQRSGVIINTASTFGFVGTPGFSAYCASKGGVVAFTKAIALEVAPYNIRVNCICPGTIETPMTKRLWAESGKPNEMRAARLTSHPIGRLGTPEDIALTALFLASDESSFITGSAIFVDGGYTAQ